MNSLDIAAASRWSILLAALAIAPLVWAVRWACARYGPPQRLWITLAGGGLVTASACLAAPDPATLAASLALGWTALTLALIDIQVYRLPDPLTLPLILLGLAWAWRVGPSSLPDHLLGAAAGGGALALVAIAYSRLRGRDGLGMGDAKLMAAAGAWLGWRPLPFVLLAASVLGLTLAVVLARRDAAGKSGRSLASQPVPFGAPLALAIWGAWLTGLVWPPA